MNEKNNANNTAISKHNCFNYFVLRPVLAFWRSKKLALIRDERGSISILILSMYLVVFFTLTCFVVGMGAGIWKNATAKYMWFNEALDFAVSAANETGSIEPEELESKKSVTEQYFLAAMDQIFTDQNHDYTFKDLDYVDIGDDIPGGVTARSPGYVAEIEVPIFIGKIPLVGEQNISIPMKYYAVIKSSKI